MASLASQQCQALRSSCDRCRAHKLKCSGASGWRPNANNANQEAPIRPCDRCLRAKADCVFGRRAPTGRRPNCASVDNDSTVSDSSIPSAASSTFSPSRSEAVSPPSSVSLSMSNGPDNGEQTYFDMAPLDYSDLDLSMELGVDDFTSANGWAWNNFDAADLNAGAFQAKCEIGQPFQSPCSWPPQGLVLNTKQLHSVSDGTQSCMLSLSALLADIVRTSNELGNGLWRMSNVDVATSELLSQYPIGSVLHLAQKFREIHHEIAGAYGYTSRNGSMDSTMSMQSLSESVMPIGRIFSIPGVDVSTRCLALSCHISLVRLYGVVFQDLENILEILPTSPSQAHDNTLNSLRLCELPSLSESRSKVHTAVSMLLRAFSTSEMSLDSLQETDGQAPVANMLSQDTILGSSSAAIQNEFERASNRLQSLERLLLRKQSVI